MQNLAEAEYSVALFMYMRLCGYPAEKITLLTTYNGQKHLLRDIVERRAANNPLIGRPHKVIYVYEWWWTSYRIGVRVPHLSKLTMYLISDQHRWQVPGSAERLHHSLARTNQSRRTFAVGLVLITFTSTILWLVSYCENDIYLDVV